MVGDFVRKRNRNKIKIYMFFLLLVIVSFVSIGYAYLETDLSVKSTVRIKAKLQRFNYYVNGEAVDSIPDKSNDYVFDASKSSCTNGVTLSFDYSDYKPTLSDSETKTVCDVYLKSAFTDGTFAAQLVSDNGGAVATLSKKIPTLTKSAVTQNYYDSLQQSCSAEGQECKNKSVVENGLWTKDDDYGTSYFFRGGDLNNNVILGNFCWKIIRINGDGSVRMIYNGTSSNGTCSNNGSLSQIGISAFSSTKDDNVDMFYMYGTRNSTLYEEAAKNTNDSTIKAYIDDWYSKNMTAYTNLLGDELFCNDREIQQSYNSSIPLENQGSGSVNTSYKSRWRRWGTDRGVGVENVTSQWDIITLKCSQKNDRFTVNDKDTGNGALKYPVGLLTMDEAILAGGNGSGWVSGINRPNKSFYLYTGQTFWLLTTYRMYSDGVALVFAVYANGFINHWNLVTGSYGVRPVINLKFSTMKSQGTGTVDSPYVVE